MNWVPRILYHAAFASIVMCDFLYIFMFFAVLSGIRFGTTVAVMRTFFTLITFMIWISRNLTNVFYTYPEYQLLFPSNTILVEPDVFYKPGTNEPIAQISWDTLREDTVLQSYPWFLGNYFLHHQPPLLQQRHIFRRIYGFPECECRYSACTCCVDIKFRLMMSRETGCVRITRTNDNATFTTALLFEDEVMMERQSFFIEKLPALCTPIPRFRIVSACVRVTNVEPDGFNLRGCVNFELKITGTHVPFWKLQFACFKIGEDGFTVSRSPTASPGAFILRSMATTPIAIL